MTNSVSSSNNQTQQYPTTNNNNNSSGTGGGADTNRNSGARRSGSNGSTRGRRTSNGGTSSSNTNTYGRSPVADFYYNPAGRRNNRNTPADPTRPNTNNRNNTNKGLFNYGEPNNNTDRPEDTTQNSGNRPDGSNNNSGSSNTTQQSNTNNGQTNNTDNNGQANNNGQSNNTGNNTGSDQTNNTNNNGGQTNNNGQTTDNANGTSGANSGNTNNTASSSSSDNADRPSGRIQSTGATETADRSGNPKSASNWKDYLNTYTGGQDGLQTTDSREGRYGAPQPTDANSWKEYVDGLKNRVRDVFNAVRSGIAGKFKDQLANIGYASNVLFAAASNSQHTVGWMDPGGKTAMGYSLTEALKNSPSLVDALRKFAGKPYPNFPKNAQAKYWNAEKVGDQNYFNSALRFSKNTQDGPNATKNIFVGVAGGPQNAFSNSINGIAEVMKKDFNATNFVYHKRSGSAYQQVERAFKKISDYAKANPNKPISLAFMMDTHGNTQGGGQKEGSGEGYTEQLRETQLKSLINKYLKDQKNIGVHLIVSACHSGAYLA